MPGVREATVKLSLALEIHSNSKRGFPRNSVSPNTQLRVGEGIDSSESSCAESVPRTLELEHGTLGLELGGKGGTQLLIGSNHGQARARVVRGYAPTLPGVNLLALKYETLFSHGKVMFFSYNARLRESPVPYGMEPN